MALWAIGARITELGFTPDRVAALGENVILLVDLAWSAVLYISFLRGRGSFATIEKWQTDYLPVYAVWASTVVIGFPPLFGWIRQEPPADPLPTSRRFRAIHSVTMPVTSRALWRSV